MSALLRQPPLHALDAPRANVGPLVAAVEGGASSMLPPTRILGICLEAALCLLTGLGGPSLLGSLSERGSSSATPAYAANSRTQRAFNSGRRDSPCAKKSETVGGFRMSVGVEGMAHHGERERRVIGQG